MLPHCRKSKVGFCLVSDNSTPHYPSMNWVYSLSLGLTRWVKSPKELPVQCSWGIQINVQETGLKERKTKDWKSNQKLVCTYKMLGSVVGLVIKKIGGWLFRMISGQEGWCISQHREPAWALSLLSSQSTGGGTWDCTLAILKFLCKENAGVILKPLLISNE